jgi:hypothetical protein
MPPFLRWIDPTLEEDVQWVFIKALNVRDGALIVTPSATTFTELI